jgi:carboxymethylenebutenolidase
MTITGCLGERPEQVKPSDIAKEASPQEPTSSSSAPASAEPSSTTAQSLASNPQSKSSQTQASETKEVHPGKNFKVPVETVSSTVRYPSGGITLSGYLSRPMLEDRFPAVVILHGTEGYQDHHKEFAERLAANGYVALAVCWFGCSGGRSSLSEIELVDVVNTVSYLKSLNYVDEDRIGVVGFSRGASLALLSASRIREFKAVVEYYGPARISSAFKKILQTSATGSDYGLENLNGPVLILHGTDDQIVKVRAAYSLENILKNNNKVYEKRIYKGVGHAFNWKDGKGVYNHVAAEDAFNRTVAFFDKYLWK